MYERTYFCLSVFTHKEFAIRGYTKTHICNVQHRRLNPKPNVCEAKKMKHTTHAFSCYSVKNEISSILSGLKTAVEKENSVSILKTLSLKLIYKYYVYIDLFRVYMEVVDSMVDNVHQVVGKMSATSILYFLMFIYSRTSS